jgi:hypothetical protein
MPAKDISDHRPFPFGCGLIHSIHSLDEFGLHEAQILIRGGIRQCHTTLTANVVTTKLKRRRLIQVHALPGAISRRQRTPLKRDYGFFL